ncbi:MAG TPA: hypothetical protein VKG92_11000, partial [Flavobacteriales bacterium]|nr:hypothetical protein [Flavobacteriales bacterium]
KLSHKPNKSLFPERRPDGSIDTSGARVLSSTTLFHEHDLQGPPVGFPQELELDPTAAGELTTILWEQELLFQGASIFRNQSIGWVDPTVQVAPGKLVALPADVRWREDNLLSVR